MEAEFDQKAKERKREIIPEEVRFSEKISRKNSITPTPSSKHLLLFGNMGDPYGMELPERKPRLSPTYMASPFNGV